MNQNKPIETYFSSAFILMCKQNAVKSSDVQLKIKTKTKQTKNL